MIQAIVSHPNDGIERRLGVDVAGPEPQVGVATTDLGKAQFSVQLLCPTQQAAGLEQALTGEFLSAVHGGTFTAAGSAAAAPAARADSA